MVNDFLKTVNKINKMPSKQHGEIFKADFQPVANPKTVPLGGKSCVFAKKPGAGAPRWNIRSGVLSDSCCKC